MAVPSKVSERFTKEVKRFQDILKNAKDRDVNEADTVVIITDMLANIFGYDKYAEITREFAIRGTYCDLAVKENGAVKYLIEVKAIGLDLKEAHLKQAIDYGANKGVKYAMLTNGIIWDVYGIKYERPIQYEKVFSINFLSLNPRSNDDQEVLYLLCKEAITKAAIRAGVDKDIYNHILRHAFGTHAIEAGVNIKALQGMMGHSTVKVTEIYTHIGGSFIKQEGEKIRNARRQSGIKGKEKPSQARRPQKRAQTAP